MRTPNFKRVLRGPRGGYSQAPTPCADCVAFDCCRPGPVNQPFGCDSWVHPDGRRVDPEADDAQALGEEADLAEADPGTGDLFASLGFEEFTIEDRRKP